MKTNSSFLLAGLAGVCLLGIGLVVVTNFIKHPPVFDLKKEVQTRILGQQTIQAILTPAQKNVKEFIQNAVDSSKDVMTQKVLEVEKKILTSIQKEVSTLTENQIEALKVQICKDLGVVK